MAQALLNNLNIIKDDSFNAKNTVSLAESMKDFSKVLEKKTTCDQKIQNNSSTDDGKLKNAIDDAMKESAAEDIVDTTLDKNATTENQLEETDKDTNITEEDSTMEKELTPLESPAAAIMLHAQISHKSHNITNEELLENQDELLLKQNNLVLKNLKQIDKDLSNEQSDFAKIDLKENHRNLLQESKKAIDEAMIKDLNIESISSAESEGAASGDLMHNQNPSEQSLKLMLQGDAKYENISMKMISLPKTPDAGVEVTSTKIIEQITKQMEGMYNSSKVNIVLNPEALGKVALQILNSKEGLSAQFTVNNPETRNLLLKGVENLRENLLAHGINVDSVVIKLSEDADLKNDSDQFDWTDGSRGGNKEQGSKKEKGDEKQFEQAMFEISQNN